MNNEHHLTNAGIGVAVFMAVCGALLARAGTVEIKDAPFGMPAITVPDFPDRDFPVTDFGAKPGVKCTEAFGICQKMTNGSVSIVLSKIVTARKRPG